MSLIVFNDEESDLIYHCLGVLEKHRREEDIQRVKSNINALVELVRSISHYPSILVTETLCDVTRSVDTLMDMLRHNEGFDKIMYTPVKAVLGKGFLIAKISFFSMLLIIAKDIAELKEKAGRITECITSTVYTVMAEEVYMSIVEDRGCSETVRNRAGFLLANLWEYRLREGVNDFVPILNSLWVARTKLIPIFGTMLGTMELTQLSGQLTPLWTEFISSEDLSDDVFQSLEEFLFTLTYEELATLREKMSAMNLTVVDREKVRTMLEKKKLYDDFDTADRREMYRFFRSRRFNARFRARADMAGPHRTIEEHIMAYLLSSNKWIPTEEG